MQAARRRSLHFLLPVLSILAGCASMPSAPDVLALPGTGKGFEEFRADDMACRDFAFQQIGGRARGQTAIHGSQRQYDMAYVQCMYAKGHRVPVSATYTPTAAPASLASPPPPPPAGMPPPPPPR